MTVKHTLEIILHTRARDPNPEGKRAYPIVKSHAYSISMRSLGLKKGDAGTVVRLQSKFLNIQEKHILLRKILFHHSTSSVLGE